MNKLISTLDQIFPGYDKVMDLSTKSALTLLKKYPSSQQFLKARKSTVVSHLIKVSCSGSVWAENKYNKLLSLAKANIKTVIYSNTLNILVLDYVDLIQTLDNKITAKEKQVSDLCQSEDYLSNSVDLVDSIPGIDYISAATLIGEIVDVSYFSKPGKLVAFCGVDPSIKQSGNFNSTHNKMSKRGSPTIRYILFNAAMANIRKKGNHIANKVLYNTYKTKTQSKAKMKCVGLIMRKLVLILYAVLRDRKPFEIRTPKQHKLIIQSKLNSAA